MNRNLTAGVPYLRTVTLQQSSGMTPYGFKLFHMFGTPFRLHVSWLPLAPPIVWILARVLFPMLVPELSAATYWGMAMAGALGVLLSVVLRELMQGLVCRLRGVRAQSVTLTVLGGAWQLHDRAARVGDEFWLAASGFVASLAIGAVLFILLFATATSGTPLAAAGVMFFLAGINGGLAAANLLPAYPFGTGRLLRAALRSRVPNASRAHRATATMALVVGIAAAGIGAVTLARGSPVSGGWLLLLGGLVCWFALHGGRDETDDTRTPRAH